MRVAIHEQRSIAGPQNTVMRKKLVGSSLYRRLQGSGTSPWQNELPKSRFNGGGGFPNIPEEAQIGGINGFRSQKRSLEPFRELLGGHSPKEGIDSASPMVEKTVYVDSVHKAVSPKFKALEETPSVNAILTNIEKSNISCKHQDLCEESIASADVKLPGNGYLDYGDHKQQQQQFKKVENIENCQEIKSHCPAPPPPPKSPSESWLWRTLPSVSTRNLPPLSFLAIHATKTPPADPKWETVVKTKKVRQTAFVFTEII